MTQSLVKNLIHLVYSTKNRHPWVSDEFHDVLGEFQAASLAKLECKAIIIGGVEDHVHTLFSLSKNHALKTVVEHIKKTSSKWMKTAGSKNADFYWQRGYAAFSVSESNVESVKRYIANQKEHHRKISFQDEMRELFQRHSLEFDERYVWD